MEGLLIFIQIHLIPEIPLNYHLRTPRIDLKA